MHPKKSYHLEFQDEDGNDRNVPLLGMPKESDWVLYACYTDKTMIRDMLAQSIWKAMGHYAVRCQYIELYTSSVTNLAEEVQSSKFDVQRVELDDKHSLPRLVLTKRKNAAGADPNKRVVTSLSPRGEGYQGIYILMESIKRGKHRVNIEKLSAEDNAEPEISGGYILKKDSLGPGEHGFLSTRGLQFVYVEPKERNVTELQKQWLYDYVLKTEKAMRRPDFEDPVNGYAAYIDVNSFVDYHWFVEVTRNVDGYANSVYLHKDRKKKLTMGPVWDCDLTFGNAFFQEAYKTNGWGWERCRGTPEYSWYERLFASPDFLQLCIDRWTELRTNVLATSKVLARVDGLADQIRQAQIRNFKRWPTLGINIHPNWYVGETWEDEVLWLKRWAEARLAWIDSQGFPAPLVQTKTNVAPSSLDVSLFGSGGPIYYTLDGSDPRLPEGRISSSAVRYEAPIKTTKIKLFARIRGDLNLWSAPVVLAVDIESAR